MYATKSFCNINYYVSNVPGQDSPIGEATPEIQTYSRELGIYRHTTIDGYTLFNLKSSDDTGTKQAMTQALVDQGIELSAHIVNYVRAVNGEIFHDQLLTDLQTFIQTKSITGLSLGPIVNHGGVYFPDWVKWSSTNHGSANENTIWFSAAALAVQYTEFEIVVVPPFDNLDYFFQSYTNVNARVASITLPDTMERIQAARGSKPYTYLRSDQYEYINPVNTAQRVMTDWTIMIYGPAGNNIDAIKDELVKYILANSTHTRNEWTQILPDIFKRTEFVLAPHWNQYAVPNRTLQAGVYSPVVKASDIVSVLQAIIPSYATVHIQNHASVFGHNYNSLAISTIGGIDNRDTLYEFVQVFPDYIDVGSGTTDFNRMSPETQQFSTILSEMLIIAETMNQFTELPNGYTKLIRDNIVFIVKTYTNIQFLVASKPSLIAALP